MINYGTLYAGKGQQKQGLPLPDDESLANLIAAIAGGIEAPVQFILQVNCVLNCIVLLFWFLFLCLL